MATNYIICSNRNDDFSRIDNINLNPAVSTQFSMLQITNINTLANFQIISEDDFIEFVLECDSVQPITYKLTGKSTTGMSLEAVPGVINQWIRTAGHPLLLTLGSLRRFFFEEKLAFRLIGMSYNFAVLLGWYNFSEDIVSTDYNVSVPRRDKDKTDPIRVTTFTFAESWTQCGSSSVGLDWQKKRETYQTPSFVLEPYNNLNGYANRWEVIWALEDETPPIEWVQVDPNTGTAHILTEKLTAQNFYTDHLQASIIAKLYDGNKIPAFSYSHSFEVIRSVLTTPDKPDPLPEGDTWQYKEPALVLNKPEHVMLFGETGTVSLRPDRTLHIEHTPDATTHYYSNYISDVTWYLLSQNTVKFTGDFGWSISHNRWEAVDNGLSVPIQACSNEDEEEIHCRFTAYDMKEKASVIHEDSMIIKVLNDVLEIPRKKIEAPAVGNPLSTPQLYLKSNCGAQVFQNSMLKLDDLTNSMVSATIHNSFSAGYTIQASGDAPVKIGTALLSNLSFQLVDGNFQPLKLLNPMYLTLSVTPIPEDPKELEGMIIPKTAPERAAQKEAQAKADAITKTQNDAYQALLQYFGPLVQQQQAQQQQAEQQQQVEQNKIELLQNLDFLSALSDVPKAQQPSYLEQMAQQMLQQQMQEQQQQQAQEEAVEEGEVQAGEEKAPELAPFMFDANNLDTDF
jgi:hypothetical protein